MDPLSLGFGIAGLLPLAIEVAKLASNTKKVVESYKSASKEARELVERLAWLEVFCNIIEHNLANRQNRQNLPNSPDHVVLDTMSAALADCRIKMGSLDQVVTDFGTDIGGTRRKLSRIEIFSRIRFLLRKDKVKDIVLGLDNTISLLQLMINTETWMMLSARETALSLSYHDLETKLNTVDTTQVGLPPKFDDTECRTLSRTKRVVNKQVVFASLAGEVALESTKHLLCSLDSTPTVAESYKSTVFIRLPFTPYRFEFQYVQFMGSPSCSLNVSHIVDRASDLCDLIFKIVSNPGQLLDLQRLLSERKLSVYSIVCGATLFDISVSMKNVEWCRYLLDNDFRHKFAECKPRVAIARSRCILSPDKTCEVTETFLSLRRLELSTADIKFLIDSNWDPAYFQAYLEKFLKYSIDDHNELVQYAWKKLAMSYVLSIEESPHKRVRTDLDPRWIPSFRLLIENGANVHQGIYNWMVPYHSAYQLILLRIESGFDIDLCLYAWLGMLRAAGLSLGPYLDNECRKIRNAGTELLFVGRKVVMVDFEGLLAPSWRWESAPGGVAYEVLEEFKYLGYQNLDSCPQPRHAKDIEVWTRGINVDVGFSFFKITPILHVKDPMRKRPGRHNPYYHETYRLAAQVMERRLERRLAKTWRKAHPKQKPAVNKMPGSWVDD